mmetsp:Transcript_51008/g.115939  ORF Transcript_51008/g.115939 Transcript_51008/m.115939 type:complete len:402 (-) Transcript_51008:7-1212(-)
MVQLYCSLRTPLHDVNRDQFVMELRLRNYLSAQQRLDNLKPGFVGSIEELSIQLLASLLVAHHDSGVGVAASVLQRLQERIDERLVPDNVTGNQQIRARRKRLNSLRQRQPVQDLEFAGPSITGDGRNVVSDVSFSTLSDDLAIGGVDLRADQRRGDGGNPTPAPQIDNDGAGLIWDPLLELVLQRLGQHHTCIPDAKTCLVSGSGVVHLHLQGLTADLEIAFEIEFHLQQSGALEAPRRGGAGRGRDARSLHLLRPHHWWRCTTERHGGCPDYNFRCSLGRRQSRLLPRYHHPRRPAANWLTLGHLDHRSASGLRNLPRLTQHDTLHGLRNRLNGVATAADRHRAAGDETNRHARCPRHLAQWLARRRVQRRRLWGCPGASRCARHLGHDRSTNQLKTGT